MHVALVLGARPQFVKSAPLVHLARRDKQVQLDIIHTGQHYDYEMAKIFFEELSLPEPAVNLGVGSGTHAQQTAKIMLRLEETLQNQKPDMVLVPGDTNSTIAGALTAAKLQLPVAHVEAGARSGDMSMPEEINRRLTDHCSTLLFTPTENCTRNLQRESIDKNRIVQAGDTMYDVLLQNMPKTEKNPVLKALQLKRKNYALLTMHRPENVDNRENLTRIIAAMVKLKPLTIVFPVHPRTEKQLRETGLHRKLEKQSHIKTVKPLGYHETLQLIKNAQLVLTDSGGMQKEAFWVKTPCITLRRNTEWTETLQLKANHLTGTDTRKIVATAKRILKNEDAIRRRLETAPNPFGDGRASEKILAAIKAFPIRSN